MMAVAAQAQHRHEQHQAAIALNNIAVSLLARGFYRDALAILKDAIQLMRSTTQGADPPPCVSSRDIQDTLHQAYHRKAICEGSDCGTKESESPNNSPKLHVISNQLDPARVYDILTLCTNSSELNVCFPMTIDLIDSEGCTSDDLAFEASVVLYNYGVVYECVAATTGDCLDPAAMSVRARVHHIFQMVGVVLSKIEPDAWYGNLTSAAARILLLEIVLTHIRIDVAIKLDLQHEYNDCCLNMQYLLQMVEYQRRLLPLDDQAVAAAA
jgi:hypothetical protein